MKRSLEVLVATLALSLFIPAYSAASSDYGDGLNLYKAKNYRAAAAKFEAAMRGGHMDPNLVYYCALSHQLSSNRARARQLYEYITTNYSSSPVASMAFTALGQLGGAPPSAGSSSGGASAGGSSSSMQVIHTGSTDPSYLANVPDEIRVPLIRRSSGQSKAAYCEVNINGRGVVFHVDTGAGSTVMGANQMEELGFGRPGAGEHFKMGGVGDRDNVRGWMQKVDLKLNSIYRRDFVIAVQDNLEGEPLLGQDFLKDFNLTVDDRGGQIILRKKSAKSSSTQARGTVDIPFKVAENGRHILVDALVNGRKYTFYFDTGADSVCFSMDDLKRLGIPVPDGPPTGRSMGIAGLTNTWVVPVESLALGKIKKENFNCSVVEKTTMDHPLMGQSFFGNYRYTVDTAAKVIHLTDPDM